MWCCKCRNELSECTCSDLEERLAKIRQCKHVFISPDYKEELDKQAKKNKDEKTVAE